MMVGFHLPLISPMACANPHSSAAVAGGKRTLVVRLGRRRASHLFGWLVLTAFALLAFLPLAGAPVGVWLGGVGVIPAYDALRRLVRQPESTAAIIPAQAKTLLAFLLYALGTGTGFLIEGFLT